MTEILELKDMEEENIQFLNFTVSFLLLYGISASW